MDKKVESNNKNENSRLQGDETQTEEVTPDVDEGHYHHSRDSNVYKGEDEDQDQDQDEDQGQGQDENKGQSWTVSAIAAVQEGHQVYEEKAEEEEKEIDKANLKEKLKLKLLKDPSKFAADWTEQHYKAYLKTPGCQVDSLQLIGKLSGNRGIQLRITFGIGDLHLRSNFMNTIPPTKLTSLHVAVYFVRDIYGLLKKVKEAIEEMDDSQTKERLKVTFAKYKVAFSDGQSEYEKVKTYQRSLTWSRHRLPEDIDLVNTNTKYGTEPQAMFLNSKLVAGYNLEIPYGLDYKYSHNFLLLSGFTVDMKQVKVDSHASGQVEGPNVWASRYCKAPGKESYKLKNNKRVENVPVVDFHRCKHTSLISKPCNTINNFDRLAIMINVLSDNLMITSRDFLVQMLAVLLRQPPDQLASQVVNSYLQPSKLKLLVLDNSNAPHKFILIKDIDTQTIEDYYHLKVNYEQAINQAKLEKAKQIHKKIKGMLADDNEGHVLKMVQAEILQGKEGPWVIAVHHMKAGSKRASQFIVVKLASDGRRIPKVQDRKVFLCHCGEVQQVDITEYLKDFSILDPIGGLFKNAIKHTLNHGKPPTVDKETKLILKKRSENITLTYAEEEVRKAFYKQITKRSYIRKVELYGLELMEYYKDDEILTVQGIRNMFAAFSKYKPTPSSLTRCKYYFASGLYLQEAEHSRFAQYAILKGYRADYSFQEFESTNVKCSLNDMVLVQQHNKPSSKSQDETQEQMMSSVYETVKDIFKSCKVLTLQGGIEISCVYNDWVMVQEQIWKVYLNNLSKCWIASVGDSIQPYIRKAKYLAAVIVIMGNAEDCISRIRYGLLGTLEGYDEEEDLINAATSFYTKLKDRRMSIVQIQTKDKKKKHANKPGKFPAVFLDMDYKQLLQDQVTLLNSKHEIYTVNCSINTDKIHKKDAGNTDKIHKKDAGNVAEDKVALSFSIFELKHKTTFHQLLLHFHRLACGEEINNTFIIEKQLYFEYSPQGNLVCLKNPPTPDFTLMTNQEYMNAWVEHQKFYILSKFVKDDTGTFIPTMDISYITGLLEKQGVRKEESVSSSIQVTGKETGSRGSSHGLASARGHGSLQAAPAWNSQGALNDLILSSQIPPAVRQRIMDAVVALNHYLEVNNLDLTNALGQLMNEAQANNMQGAHACPICETAFDICSDGGDLLYPSHSFCECQPPLCTTCILDTANSVNGLCRDCKTYGIFPLTLQTAKNLGVLKAFVDSFRRDPREFVIGEDMMVHVKTFSKGLKAVVLEEEDKEDEQPPTLSQSDNRGRITRTEQSIHQVRASLQPVPLQNRSGKVEKSLVPPWMKNHVHSNCKGESPCSFEQKDVKSIKLGKDYPREENQACKPQEEEKKREVDKETTSAIKKRDAKQASKSHGKDQEVSCLGQSSVVSCGGEAVDTGKVLSESRQSRPKDHTQRQAKSQQSSPHRQTGFVLQSKDVSESQQEHCRTGPPKGSKVNSSLYGHSNKSYFNFTDHSNAVPKNIQQSEAHSSTHEQTDELMGEGDEEGDEEGEGEGISNQVGLAN